MFIFTEGGKPENPEKNPHGKRTTHQTNKTHICSEQESNPDHSGERRALTHYACTHATLVNNKGVFVVFDWFR
jgi:hypothetical protein